MINNRINFQPDYLLSIVRVPVSWQPDTVYEIPPSGKIVSQMPVASFDEAHDDLVRCNELALALDLREWAVIQTDKSKNAL